MSDPPAPARPRPGRPRDAAVDGRILAAAAELLAQEGYEAATIDAIAARAGVGRATIYRRWPGKDHVLVAAALAQARPPLPAVGTPRRRLELLLHGVLLAAAEDRGSVARLMDQAPADPALAERLRTELLLPLRAEVASLAAELAPDSDAAARDLAVDVVLGAATHRARSRVLLGLPSDARADAQGLARLLCDGLLGAPKPPH